MEAAREVQADILRAKRLAFAGIDEGEQRERNNELSGFMTDSR